MHSGVDGRGRSAVLLWMRGTARAALGATLKRWLTQDRWRKLFSGAIALLTVYSVVAMWL